MLTEFHVSGYKSLYDCTISDLCPINVFHGDNNVGKSNILEALRLFLVVLNSKGRKEILDTYLKNLDEWVSWGREKVQMAGSLQIADQSYKIQVIIQRGQTPPSRSRSELVRTVKTNLRDGGWQTPPVQFQSSPPLPAGNLASLYHIPARRRLEMEQETRAEQPLNPEGANLKERLFWASVSQNQKDRQAFYQVLRPLFAEPPLELGTLQPVAAPGGPYDLQIETGSHSIPLEQMGSGIQQLVLMAGLVALSRADVIAIEEPEMNLSWSTQKNLRLIFQQMVARQDVPPRQIFLSSHSPLFEFYENFYRVEIVDGKTRVTLADNKERRRIFDRTLPPSDRRAAWLHDENVVVLPAYVTKTLDVRQGDMLYFVPQDKQVLMVNEQDFTYLTKPEDEEE